MSICVLKRGNLCENEARFVHQNEVNLRDRETTNLDLFRMHLHRQPTANQKLDLRSPIVDRKNQYEVNIACIDTFIYDLLCQVILTFRQ